MGAHPSRAQQELFALMHLQNGVMQVTCEHRDSICCVSQQSVAMLASASLRSCLRIHA